MKINKNESGSIVVDGEFESFLFPKGDRMIVMDEFIENLTITGFIGVGMHSKTFGSYWKIDGQLMRYIHDAGDKGLAFLTDDNKYVLVYEKDIKAQRANLLLYGHGNTEQSFNATPEV